MLLAVRLLWPLMTHGQVERPSEQRPELPSFQPPQREPGLILPPVPLPSEPSVEGLAAGVRVFVRDVRIIGATVLSQQELDNFGAPYRGRTLTFADLDALRDQITTAYIRRGYVSSGAVLPDQTITDGVVEIQVVEGVLEGVDVHIDGRLRPSYVRDRLLLAAPGVVNVHALEDALRVLQQDPRIGRIQAELVPGKARGESLLRVQVFEAPPYDANIQFDNYQAPSVGAERGRIDLAYLNVTGVGDSASTTLRIAEGLLGIDAAYEIPVNARDTTLQVHLQNAWSKVVEAPFDSLDIKSRAETYGFTIGHPVYRSLQSRFALFFTGEWRRSKDFLLGSGFQFSEGISEDGVAQVAVLRFGHDWTYRGRTQAFAVRNTLSLGLDVLGATSHPGDTPDSQFLAWLGQVQWARRLPLGRTNVQLLARADIQLATSPLLGMEQFALGGHATVRGYRENEVVRDNGVDGSVEIDVPVLTRSDGSAMVEVAAFFDAGHSWGVHGGSEGLHTLASPGLGLRVAPTDHTQCQVYWGHALTDAGNGGDLQDSGLQFMLSLRFP